MAIRIERQATASSQGMESAFASLGDWRLRRKRSNTCHTVYVSIAVHKAMMVLIFGKLGLQGSLISGMNELVIDGH